MLICAFVISQLDSQNFLFRDLLRGLYTSSWEFLCVCFFKEKVSTKILIHIKTSPHAEEMTVANSHFSVLEGIMNPASFKMF